MQNASQASDVTDQRPSSMRRVLIAIPAFNEEATVNQVVAEVRRAVPRADIVVVDDGSTDETARVAQESAVRVLRLPFNVGVGGAMRLAYLYAADAEYDAVVQVDADGQHDPSQVPELLTCLDQASVVIGSRFAGSGKPSWISPIRHVAIRFLARSVSAISHSQLDDVTSGFRAADRRAITLFARHYPSEYLGDTVESLVLASRAGLPISQVPVTMRNRQGGVASHGPLRSSVFLVRAVMAIGVAVIRKPIKVAQGPT